MAAFHDELHNVGYQMHIQVHRIGRDDFPNRLPILFLEGIVFLVVLLLHQVEDVAENKITGPVFPPFVTVGKELLPELLRHSREKTQETMLQSGFHIFRLSAFS